MYFLQTIPALSVLQNVSLFKYNLVQAENSFRKNITLLINTTWIKR